MPIESEPLEFFWFLPSSGDNRYLNHQETNRWPTPTYLRDVALAAERLGYYGILLPTGAHCVDPLITAASIATITNNLRLLVGVRPGLTAPAESVRQAAALDRLTGGRALINFVTGGSPQALAGDGLFLNHDHRYEQTAEFLSIWRELAEGRQVSKQGKYLSLENGRLMYPFCQSPRPPIYFGGSSDIARTIAAENADVYLAWGEPPRALEAVFSDVRQRAAAVGRSIKFGVRLHLFVRETEAEAWDAANETIKYVTDEAIDAFKRAMQSGSDSVGQARMSALHQSNRRNLEISPNLWAGIGLVRSGAGTALVGDAKTVAERIQEYRDIGVTTIIASGYPHLEESERVADLLFPHLDLRAPGSPLPLEFTAPGSSHVPQILRATTAKG